MNAVEVVQRCWSDLAARQGCDGPAAADALTGILAAYSEPHRHYHTVEHIAALLVLLNNHADSNNDRDAVALAILLHDVIYDPARQDNEAASAHLARDLLSRLGISQAMAAKVAHYITATRHDRTGTPVDDADLALLLDLDLSILAAASEEYQDYAQAIRREYAFVPEAIYRAGRRRMLEGFLARVSVYRTARLRDAWESAARANMARELDGLG